MSLRLEQYLIPIVKLLEVRMLGGPMRLCLLSNRHLPRGSSNLTIKYEQYQLRLPDFLIRYNIIAPGKTSKRIIVPDGEEHPKFRTLRDGPGKYMMCSKAVVLDYTTLSESYDGRPVCS